MDCQSFRLAESNRDQNVSNSDQEAAGKNRSSLWDAYCSFVYRNHVSLELLDTGLSRILFWAPTTSGSKQGHRNREVLYGILSLHRLAMDTALQQQEFGMIDNDGLDYGMTVRLNPPPPAEPKNGIGQDSSSRNNSLPTTAPFASPTTICITITVIQSLLPSILELSRSSSSSSSLQEDYDAISRQHKVRLYLERIKFGLRLILLISYWRRIIQQQKQKTSGSPLSLGIMTDAGLFHGFNNDHHENDIPTLAQEDALWQRRTYVGRRTGRRVVQRTPNGRHTTTTTTAAAAAVASKESSFSSHSSSSLLMMIGEILYAYRPLYWANAEAKRSTVSYRNWLIAFTMDLISLQCCGCHEKKHNNNTTNNYATQKELSRRKMRLLLYLLRAPVWDRWTEPGANRLEDLLDQVPLLGRLASTYLRDWLWYMKHPYVAEQG